MDKRVIRDFAGRVMGKVVGQGDVQLKFCLPGNREHEVVVRDVPHGAGVYNSLSQSRLMVQGLWIAPGNGYGMKIYDNRRQGCLVAVAP
jgi:hypothetical protein